MHVARTLDRVYVDRGEKVFVVTWIDKERRLVDLMPLTGHGQQEDVRWEQLYPAVVTEHAPIRAARPGPGGSPDSRIY